MEYDFEKMYISELIEIRQQAREAKNWELSDSIRNYLDKKFTFIFDTKQGQVIYHELKGMTRQKLIDKINQDIVAEKRFDAWLYSINKSTTMKGGTDMT